MIFHSASTMLWYLDGSLMRISAFSFSAYGREGGWVGGGGGVRSDSGGEGKGEGERNKTKRNETKRKGKRKRKQKQKHTPHLELKLDVEEKHLDLGQVRKTLRLLLKTGVGKRLLECDALDELGLGDGAASDLLDADHLEVEGSSQGEHGVDTHGRKELLVAGDELGVHRRARALLEQAAQPPVLELGIGRVAALALLGGVGSGLGGDAERGGSCARTRSL